LASYFEAAVLPAAGPDHRLTARGEDNATQLQARTTNLGPGHELDPGRSRNDPGS